MCLPSWDLNGYRESDEDIESLAELLRDSDMVDGYWPDFLPLVAPIMISKLKEETETIGEAAYWEERQGGEKITEEQQDAYVEDREELIGIWADAQNDAEAVDADSHAILLEYLREMALRG